ncbi:MAG: cell wall hydrolase [Sphingomonadaceae bacterium]
MSKTVRVGGLLAAALALSAAASMSAPSFAASIEGLLGLGADGPPAAPAPTLGELVAANAGTRTADVEQDCLASAVYFEARGERLDGQLAVADVVMNRVESERYPDTICEVVEQPWQFSFVNATGRIPEANRASAAWRKAVAISTVALEKLDRMVSEDVLWYHADYVAPAWGPRLERETKIGLHIFYS